MGKNGTEIEKEKKSVGYLFERDGGKIAGAIRPLKAEEADIIIFIIYLTPSLSWGGGQKKIREIWGLIN